MNIEIGRRSCHEVINRSSRERNFWMPSIGTGVSSRPSTGRGLIREEPSKLRYESVSKQELRRREIAASMKTVLNGLGGGKEKLDKLNQASLHVLMALKESGQDALVRRILIAGDDDLEWQVSLRHSEGEEI